MTTRTKSHQLAKTTTAPARPADAVPEPSQSEPVQTRTPMEELADAVAGARSAYLALADGRSWGQIPSDQRQEIQRMTKWLADMHLR